MNSDQKSTRDPSVLRIEGELTIFRAQELKPELLGNPMPLEIDLSGVTELDTAGLQLLMLAKQAALKQQRELRLVAHSPAVLEVFELLNVAAYFGDPLLMHGTSNPNATRRTNES
jgi:anti-anti-sigma factor